MEGEREIYAVVIYCPCPYRQWPRMIQTSDTCIKRIVSSQHQNQTRTPPTHLYRFQTRLTFPQIPLPLRKKNHQNLTKIKHLVLLPHPSPLAVALWLILLPKTHPMMIKICRTPSSLPLCVKRGCHPPCVGPVGAMEMVEGGTSLSECSARSLSCSF